MSASPTSRYALYGSADPADRRADPENLLFYNLGRWLTASDAMPSLQFERLFFVLFQPRQRWPPRFPPPPGCRHTDEVTSTSHFYTPVLARICSTSAVVLTEPLLGPQIRGECSVYTRKKSRRTLVRAAAVAFQRCLRFSLVAEKREAGSITHLYLALLRLDCQDTCCHHFRIDFYAFLSIRRVILITLGLDIGSNSVGSAWFDSQTGKLTTGTSIFPAGVDESDDKRGDPKNAKRRMVRRTRITLARRAQRKRELRLKLIEVGLLPSGEDAFTQLLDETDPWVLRGQGLDESLTPHQFGRVLLHLAQRRGALGLKLADMEEDGDAGNDEDDGKVKAAIGEVRAKMLERKARTFGEFIAMVRAERVTPIASKDRRSPQARKGPREYRDAVRNKAGSYEHCADRNMIRDEFAKLWDAQKAFGSATAPLLTDELRLLLDNEAGDADWRHKGLLFGQRRQTWDLGTLGRCVLEPTERCAPHADMNASRYLVVETVNNLRVIEYGKESRALTCDEREKIKAYLSGPLGMETPRKTRGQTKPPAPRPKTKVNVGDLRDVMGWPRRAGKNPTHRFNIETDEDRQINTDWFSREIIHVAVTPEKWASLPDRVREGLNRAILKFDPDEPKHPAKFKAGVMDWAGLDAAQADALVAAWRKRPRPDAKRLNMSRRAVRNLLTVMDRDEPWQDENRPGEMRWLTAIEARKQIAEDGDFKDVTSGKPLNDHARRRYATGAKGATARDRYYMRKHILRDDKGDPIIDLNDKPLSEPPPAPLISNPVVRKAIHEVRRHLVAYMTHFGERPDQVYIELAREAKMGKVDADRALFKNRLRNRIRNEIIREFDLDVLSSTQQRAAVDRVIRCVHQDGVCPLCGNQTVKTKITLAMAAMGNGCQIAHIIPRASGGHNGFSNTVLAHDKCNQLMGRRTPREFWEATMAGGFDEGMRWVESIYSEIRRIKPSETKTATGVELWKCYLTEQARPKKGSKSPLPPNYFTNRFDRAVIEQFKKDVTDIQGMTQRQEAATKYASRQVMTYLADALFDGKGLPERSSGNDDRRKIFATDGMWTSRLRREWGLFFDPHQFKAKGLDDHEEHERKEKNRGDHRHHAIDAVVIALSSFQMRRAWEDRETQAGRELCNSADEATMENYRRRNSLPPPAPFKDRETFRRAVHEAVFGHGDIERPICHRPVKRKLIGALHKATQYGPVVDTWSRDGTVHREAVEGRVTVRQNVLGATTPTDFLKPSHLRMPRQETEKEAKARLARRFRVGKQEMSAADADKAAAKLVKTEAFTPAMIDPKPEKGGIVRDIGLRRVLRLQLEKRGLDPDSYTRADLKKAIDEHGPLTHDSGVPIHRVVLLWSNSDPIQIRRSHYSYASGQHWKLDGPGSVRLYDGQNNHHIEIRVNEKGKWSGQIVTAFETAQRKLAQTTKLRELERPYLHLRRRLTPIEKQRLTSEQRQAESARRAREWKQRMRELKSQRAEIIEAHPVVDRNDDDEKGGRFIMSLCEGETLMMRPKGKAGSAGEVSYFVVAKLDKPQGIVLVPHWDARVATERKDAEGKKVPDSKRHQFTATPSDLKSLAPPGHDHAIKVRVNPLGEVAVLERD
ncbi:MAG: type II CRISPR RNA-guided endonuclease Cas9 [Phycisphaeraceae bacterium]